MRQAIVVPAGLLLAACASAGPAPLLPAPAAEPVPLAVYGLGVATLPARDAGAAVASGAREHVALRAAPRPGAAASADAALPARVVLAHAAYHRWCGGRSLPGDEVVLALAGAATFPAGLGCAPVAAGR